MTVHRLDTYQGDDPEQRGRAVCTCGTAYSIEAKVGSAQLVREIQRHNEAVVQLKFNQLLRKVHGHQFVNRKCRHESHLTKPSNNCWKAMVTEELQADD